MPQVHLLRTKDQALSIAWKKLYPVDDEVTLITNVHLLVEALLYRFIQAKLRSPLFLDEARMTFHQIHCLAKALRKKDESEKWFWNVTRELNSIRNAIVHNIEVRNLHSKTVKLMRLAENRIDVHAPGADPAERERKKLQVFLIILCGVAFNLKPS